MALPSFVGAGAGAEGLIAGAFTVSKTGCIAGNIVMAAMYVNGVTADWGGWGSIVNIKRLDGVVNSTTGIVNNTDTQIRIGRVMVDGTVSGNLTVGASGEDIVGRIYEFQDVTITATTLATVIENGVLQWDDLFGTSATVADLGVTTNAADRLALNFVHLRSAQAIANFTGETGGDWTEVVAEYVGTTLTLQLQTATMASKGVIDGGTATITSSDWHTYGTALIPESVPTLDPMTKRILFTGFRGP